MLAAVRRLGKSEFVHADLYALAGIFAAAYPNNSHVEPKIRQQLQVLVALGYLERTTRGEYRVLL